MERKSRRLQTYDRPILQEPHYFPTIRNGLANELRKYLDILKSVHSGADLRRLLLTCKHVVGEHTCSLAAAALDTGNDVYHALGALSRAAEARRGIAEQVRETDTDRDRDRHRHRDRHTDTDTDTDTDRHRDRHRDRDRDGDGVCVCVWCICVMSRLE